MNEVQYKPAHPRLIEGSPPLHQVTEDICAPLERAPGPLWVAGFGVSVFALLIGLVMVVHEVVTGIGTWGVNRTIGWAWGITNFVFWVGIGHAGTLISAILLLMRQRWRTSVNRSAEAMTLFAVLCAGLFPLLHLGRPWLAWWVIPYPNTRGPLWVNFRSPIVWDFMAVGTYFIVSLLFWYYGLVPDLATVRDRCREGLRKRVFTFFSLGWNGSARTWRRYEKGYLLLAGLATPLVFSVHTVVSFDFAVTLVPGWHSTIFPPYFVCGAIFSGFAMVLSLTVVARKVMGFERYITENHLDSMCKITLLTALIVALAYLTEVFMAWYSVNPYERFMSLNRLLGPYRHEYWVMLVCNIGVPQLFWFGRIRRNAVAIFLISIAINLGMWLERFIIVVTSLHRDFLPSSWTTYSPTYVEVGILFGSFGLFFTGFFLFCRFLPMISMSEVKGVLQRQTAEEAR